MPGFIEQSGQKSHRRSGLNRTLFPAPRKQKKPRKILRFLGSFESELPGRSAGLYERADLVNLFAACDEQERLWFEFFSMTGMREQEVTYCSWGELNLSRSTITVRYNREGGFSPKIYRQGEIPIPAELAKKLRALKAKSDKTCGLIFPQLDATEAKLSGQSESMYRASEAQEGRLLAALFKTSKSGSAVQVSATLHWLLPQEGNHWSKSG